MKITIGKKDINQYAQLECDKQLKNKLLGTKKIEAGVKRPGMKHITDQGGEYEKSIYNDFIHILSKDEIYYKKKGEKFENSNLVEILKLDIPPKIIIEAEFNTPNIFNYDLSIFEIAKSRPDIIYITYDDQLNKYIISIIDVKTTTEPSLKHFSEISYYKLVLEQLLLENNFNEKFIIAQNGYIWPGNNDKYFFIDTFMEYKKHSSLNPLSDSLKDILIPVPFEIYEPFVINFFQEIFPRIYKQDLTETICQFSTKCQFCDYEPYCKKESIKNDLISQIPFLSSGQHTLLFEHNIRDLSSIIDSIESDTHLWQQLIKINRNLKSQENLILARAKAISENKVIPIEDRKTYLMPNFSNLNIFITIHFDPITGLTFAMGADKVYKDSGAETVRDKTINVIGNAKGFDIKYERDEFFKFLQKINGWIKNFLEINKSVNGTKQSNLKSIHFYFWSQLEITQLRRMILRHLNDSKIQKEIALLISLYPPDGIKDDPEVYETQPGTVVKDTIKYLFGLPVKYDYTLFNVANSFIKEFHNNDKKEPFQYQPYRGFYLELSDQIPFERAYEIWTGDVYLPREFGSTEKYKRREIEELMEKSIDSRLQALESIVSILQLHYKDKLLLDKKKVKKFPITKKGMEQEAINLQMFEQLNHISSDIENKQLRVLPIDEKENRFMSIRGLKLQDNSKYKSIINQLQNKEEFYGYKEEEFMVFEYSKDSIEAKIKEGDFLVVLSNERDPSNLDMPQLNLESSLTKLTNKNAYELGNVAEMFNLNIQNFFNLTLKDLSKVSVAYISYKLDNLFIVLVANEYYGGIKTIKFLEHLNLLDLNQPLIIDPIYQDFNQSTYNSIFRIIGKK
ncbi:hypothetical protein O8C89_03515 [Aliarcobacter butzleri]|uniref:hypothetical protein n=1 Tax=Aliarcobacter butzleri TaxID=28197 RepID=UPI00263DC0EC|nr:hypothetical protein [Aliarcobacter butzleri]MDN5079587.1 hypothetical protein [Aliarcobacter butzleri]